MISQGWGCVGECVSRDIDVRGVESGLLLGVVGGGIISWSRVRLVDVVGRG